MTKLKTITLTIIGILVLFNTTYLVFATDKSFSVRSFMPPTLGEIPIKNETRKMSSGATIRRLTDASELSGTSDALIVYSRYSPESSDGKYVLVFGSNSTSSWVIERNTGKVITRLKAGSNQDIGEYHEVRWDNSGKHPSRVYYVYKMQFFMIDDISAQNKSRQLIKDFTSLVPNATRIYNDVEGDSSNDSDHWVWMAAHYNGTTNVVDAFIHFQISTGNTHTLKYSDLENTPLSHYVKEKRLPRPNMVEISPLASGIVLHYGRAWGDNTYGNRHTDIDSWFDGVFLWPIDFDYRKKTPLKISIDQTHSGWSFDENGNEYFISQNNRTDQIDAVNISAGISGFKQRIEIASHKDFGWANGFHFGKVPLSRKGWVFISTYAKEKTPPVNDWGNNQLLFLSLEKNSNDIIRIGSNFNTFTGNYRDEAPAAINLLGNRIYLSTNWGGKLAHREVFVITLPDNWDKKYN